MKPFDRVGPYTLVQPLGEDGRSWLAKAGNDQFVLKIAGTDDADGRAQLLHELHIAGAFDHPNIVPIHECGETRDGIWLTLGVRGQPGRKLTLAGFRQLLLALLHVHGHDVVHGDLRPANIFVEHEGEVMLANFSFARKVGQAAAQDGGRSAYASPEQLMGDVLDVRADLYSAGAVLYETLTGRRPNEGETVAPSVAAPGLGTAFDALAARALARDKTARFGSSFEFLLAFDSACQQGVPPVPRERR